MISTIYYFSGLFLLLLNFTLILSLRRYLFLKEFVMKFKVVTKKNPQEKDFEGDDHGFYSLTLVTDFLNFFWFFFGLIGSNWIVFLFYFIQNFLLNSIYFNSKIKLVSSLSLSLRLILTTILMSLLVFNHFHFKINLTEIILH